MLINISVSGRDGQGFPFQRYSKVALSGRKPRPIVITCPPKIELQRGATTELACTVNSEVPYTIKWYKDGRHLAGHADENKIYNQPGSVLYTITDANEDSHGIYAAEVHPTITEGDPKIDGEFKDEVAVVILRKSLPVV
ncbi:immunoglobulin domain protein [Opisthorchis viverrini]|uniref:Immunoglobulin domain protein n=1 Tax=Opisthorchis viverrini TaxID=6198 RepID=A0A1S8WHH3_OPIVI|nr:immunoglobulin domain protein [Opisthorchis viverrini]